MQYLEGSRWFRRLVKDAKRMDRNLRFKRIKCGFYRIYYKNAYLHEVYKEMPQKGYDMDDLDPRFEDQKYYEDLEDHEELTRKVKNYVEGYWDSLDRVRTRVYMMRNDKEFHDNAVKAYQTMTVK